MVTGRRKSPCPTADTHSGRGEKENYCVVVQPETQIDALREGQVLGRESERFWGSGAGSGGRTGQSGAAALGS